MKTKSGFTLMEILLTLGVLGIIVTASLMMFTSIMRGSAKTKVVNEVKQNGIYAISVMERMIRNAKSLVSPGEDDPDSHYSSITIANPDGGLTVFDCNNSLIASNGASLINSSKVTVGGECNSFFEVVKGTAGVSPDQITIKFKLVSVASGQSESRAEADFQTTVILRNY